MINQAKENIGYRSLKITKAQYNTAFTVYYILYLKKPKCPI